MSPVINATATTTTPAMIPAVLSDSAHVEATLSASDAAVGKRLSATCLQAVPCTLHWMVFDLPVTAVQDGPTSIRVSWTPSSDATGYRIHYTSSRGDGGSEDVSGGHSDSHTLTGLVKEDTYTISIMATFHTLSSSAIAVEVTLSEGDPLINSSFSSLFPQSRLQVWLVCQ